MAGIWPGFTEKGRHHVLYGHDSPDWMKSERRTGSYKDKYFSTAFGNSLYDSGGTVSDFRYVGEALDWNSGFY
jgi:hypothetical protein